VKISSSVPERAATSVGEGTGEERGRGKVSGGKFDESELE